MQHASHGPKHDGADNPKSGDKERTFDKSREAASQAQGSSSSPNATSQPSEPAIPFSEYVDENVEPEPLVNTDATRQQVNQREVFYENPNIYYMNGESLSRPFSLPQRARIGAGIIVAIAVVIAAVAFFFYFDATTNEPAREKAKLEETLSKHVTLDLPDMLSFLEMDDYQIDSTLKDTGAAFYERTAAGSAESYSIVKLPSDISLAEAAAYYSEGINKLSASQAANLLNGSWDLDVDRSNGLNMSLHYADFKSGGTHNAISNAIAAEGFSRGQETDSGENDGYGNTYTTGTIMINGTNYSWSVSAVKLSDVYAISGLPSTAVYVGIRIKDAT